MNDSGVESDNRRLIERGLLFLLKEKDRYGVWYSTQATVNVIDAFIMLLASSETGARAMAEEAEVFVNGTRAGSIAIPPVNEQAGPLRMDISRFLSRGGNRVEIRRAGRALPASVQVISAYYVPWTKALAGDSAAAASTTASNSLELSVAYDRTEVEIGGVVVCKVSARRRADSRSYGMMLAEIGLPPGADVDRASMERALKEYNVSRYDILPDRLVVYLWPYSGGSNFEFRFRPRFGLKAQTAPSVLYDYYNPDARTSLAPTRFVVR